MAEERTPAPEPPVDSSRPPPPKPPNTLTVVWIHEGPVCVTIVDSPNHPVSNGVCHCPACHGAVADDLEDHLD